MLHCYKPRVVMQQKQIGHLAHIIVGGFRTEAHRNPYMAISKKGQARPLQVHTKSHLLSASAVIFL